jgi:hypothetical protein
MKKEYSPALSIAFIIVILLALTSANAQSSPEPGSTVRNAFGPQAGDKANQCRGACGAGCPDSCAQTVSYECMDRSRLRRVATYDCGTHQGCRVHDSCLDTCLQSGAQGASCQQQCDTRAIAQYGIEAASWLMGGGPYDGRITYEYTRDAPGALEPAYRCPDGASLQCSGNIGCSADNARVEPVFDSYPNVAAGAMRVSAFRAGPLCDGRVCEQSASIQVTGADSCSGSRCTRFGMEFDYRNADPSAPLECSTSSSGGDSDFIGDLAKQGADAMQSRGGIADGQDNKGEDGMAQLLGLFGKVLSSADSPEDVNISMAPLGPDGKPIESQRIGSDPRKGPPSIPRSVDLPAASGHLLVPMYQMTDGLKPGQINERRIRCTHKGAPVLDTVFRLKSG